MPQPPKVLTNSPSSVTGPHLSDYDIGVTFYGKEFVLTVMWNSSTGSTDEERVKAAAEWFESRYGFDLIEHSLRANVLPMPEVRGS